MRLYMLSLLTLILATPAFATDGVLEINQTCAVQTGCFAGDTAGLPVTITTAGSYRLTSDLVVPSGQAILCPFSTCPDDVSIDLNGFTIDGTGSISNGIQLTEGDNWEIRNGTIKGFSSGIQQQALSDGHRMIDLRVIGASNTGIAVANGEGQQPGAGYANNVIGNNGGTVVGGIQMGTNVCDGSTTCP